MDGLVSGWGEGFEGLSSTKRALWAFGFQCSADLNGSKHAESCCPRVGVGKITLADPVVGNSLYQSLHRCWGDRYLVSQAPSSPHPSVEFDQLEEAVKSLNKELMRENRHLQDLTTQLQEKHHKISLEVCALLRLFSVDELCWLESRNDSEKHPLCLFPCPA